MFFDGVRNVLVFNASAGVAEDERCHPDQDQPAHPPSLSAANPPS